MYSTRPVRGAIAKRRLFERIELLCECGAGLEAIASPLTVAVRDYLGALSGALFWLDENGAPQGFYHDSAPAELKDLFITRLDELFVAPGQISMSSLAQIEGPSIGRALDPETMRWFLSGNVYNYLCKPLGHYWMLDMRVEVDGVGRAVYCAWNPENTPFTAGDAEVLRPVQMLMQRAVRTQRADVAWRSLNDGSAQFIIDEGGDKLIAIDPEAEEVLMTSHLLRQRVSMTQQARQAPGFAKLLAQAVAATGAGELALPVADGRIIARAKRTRSVQRATPDGDMIVVSLDLQVAEDVLLVDHLVGLDLTPLQRRIALFAMRGGERAECVEHIGVSPEALKKHVRDICAATDSTKWTDIQQVRERIPLQRLAYL